MSTARERLNDKTYSSSRDRGWAEHARRDMSCTCHRPAGVNHELCCGHDEGRDPNCPQHGDGTQR